MSTIAEMIADRIKRIRARIIAETNREMFFDTSYFERLQEIVSTEDYDETYVKLLRLQK